MRVDVGLLGGDRTLSRTPGTAAQSADAAFAAAVAINATKPATLATTTNSATTATTTRGAAAISSYVRFAPLVQHEET